jgi:hypothetical protein
MSARQRRRVAPGQALRLDGRDGELTVLAGRVWLTLGEVDEDRFLEAGARIRLRAGHGAVIGPALAGQGIEVSWRLRPPFTARCLAVCWRAAASLARLAARGFAALARQATARADLLH